MTSVYRAFAQSNTNSTALIPSLVNTLMESLGPLGDLSNAPVYLLDLTNVQFVGGSYFVDMDGLDLSGNSLNYDGRFNAGSNSIPCINFIVDVPMPASYRPNLTFTIYFKNLPTSLSEPTTIGLISANGGPLPYIYSPPAPLLNAGVHPSITLKSDATQYTVVSSGPAGWLGSYLLGSLVSTLSPP
jgi:hypothetical protein